MFLLLACTGSQTPIDRGWFETGQDAEVLLGAFGFDQSGGPSLFNHPRGVAAGDGMLAVPDSNNNRVLVWTSRPETGDPPDVVLGQGGFETNDSGSARDRMNWPVAASIGGGKLAVADAYNDRVLVWEGTPGSGSAPDFVLEGLPEGTFLPEEPTKDGFMWPWGVWTDGERLVVSSTRPSATLDGPAGWLSIWQDFPGSATQPADVLLSVDWDMGTPRGISSDGESWLLVGDHNARGTSAEMGAWIWESFPSEDEAPPDRFVPEPTGSDVWLAGDRADTGEAVLIGTSLFVWPDLPYEAEQPTVSVERGAWGLRGGDGAMVVVDDGWTWVADTNANRVLGFEGLPDSDTDEPEVVLGARDLAQDTLEEHDFITNGVPATDGRSLCVGDGYDLRLLCWREIPRSGTVPPDVVLPLDDAVTGMAMHGGTLVVSGPMHGVKVWQGLPWDGRDADLDLGRSLGSEDLDRVTSVALDGRHFYAVDGRGRLLAWEGLPEGEPVFTNDLGDFDVMLHSDGRWLTVSTPQGVELYDVNDLDALGTAVPSGDWSFELGQGLACQGHFFLVDHGFHRLYAWRSVEDALAGAEPDTLLGAARFEDQDPAIDRASLFWPERLAFDGEALWIAEYKFSGRVLGFQRSGEDG